MAVALNSLVFSEARYTGHKSFIEQCCRIIKIFRETFPDVGAITRVGWRYINVIPFSREDGVVPVGRFLKLQVPFPSDMFRSTSTLELNWSGKCFGGEVILKLAAAKQKSLPEQEALLLDIDFGRLGSTITWSSVTEVIQEARKTCRGIFEDLITDDYRSYLRGKAI